MLAVALLLLISREFNEAVKLRCGNYSSNAVVTPELRENSGILVTWDLLSSDPVCSDPSRLPRFTQLRLHDVSLIASCDSCPRCTLRLPMRYEWPLGSSINTIFIVARQTPYNRIHTDMDIRYVIVDRLPRSLRNWIFEMKQRYKARQAAADMNEALGKGTTVHATVDNWFRRFDDGNTSFGKLSHTEHLRPGSRGKCCGSRSCCPTSRRSTLNSTHRSPACWLWQSEKIDRDVHFSHNNARSYVALCACYQLEALG
ncbi:hypothetical protein RB195_002811 [Necator americanus]|uniref:Mos1 transposase HTH domain-containing protein n=1 Tax=Necator americanus TaxID=51031 RepID=A0ABR1DKT1_NECAM